MYVAEVQRGAPADRGEQIEECMRVVRVLFERMEPTVAVDKSSIIVPGRVHKEGHFEQQSASVSSAVQCVLRMSDAGRTSGSGARGHGAKWRGGTRVADATRRHSGP